jgi:hypothetical protein
VTFHKTEENPIHFGLKYSIICTLDNILTIRNILISVTFCGRSPSEPPFLNTDITDVK